jgi:hypothetical protein
MKKMILSLGVLMFLSACAKDDGGGSGGTPAAGADVSVNEKAHSVSKCLLINGDFVQGEVGERWREKRITTRQLKTGVLLSDSSQVWIINGMVQSMAEQDGVTYVGVCDTGRLIIQVSLNGDPSVRMIYSFDDQGSLVTDLQAKPELGESKTETYRRK